MSRLREAARSRGGAVTVLLLLVPAPTIGVATALFAMPGGRAVYLLAKAWILALPATWYLLVEDRRASWSPPARGGLRVGLLVGLASAAFIGAAWLVLGQRIDATAVSAATDRMGLTSMAAFAAGALGWSFANSLMEEYVYRWFVYRCLDRLLPSLVAALGSAAVFTLHHVVAMSAYLEPALVAVASVGVFAGGTAWSLLYRRFRSIWPGWIAHVLADLAIFTVGGWILFGAGGTG